MRCMENGNINHRTRVSKGIESVGSVDPRESGEEGFAEALSGCQLLIWRRVRASCRMRLVRDTGKIAYR